MVRLFAIKLENNILQSKKDVIQARIIAVSGGFYTLKLADGGGIRLRESRLYATEEDAKKRFKNRI